MDRDEFRAMVDSFGLVADHAREHDVHCVAQMIVHLTAATIASTIRLGGVTESEAVEWLTELEAEAAYDERQSYPANDDTDPRYSGA